jgi:hypothetical protein
MRPRVPERILAAAFLLCSAACATRREGPLPTLEDYSDGVSTFADEFLEDWKADRASARFYAADFEWKGPLPGDAMSRVETRAGLELSVYAGSAPVAGSELPAAEPSFANGSHGSEALSLRSAAPRTCSSTSDGAESGAKSCSDSC